MKCNGAFCLTFDVIHTTPPLRSISIPPNPTHWVHCNSLSQRSHTCIPLLNPQKMYKETKRKERDKVLTARGKLASFGVYINSTVTSNPHHTAFPPPPNQHLFVVNTAECSTADSPEHLRGGKQIPLGWKQNGEERDSQTVS